MEEEKKEIKNQMKICKRIKEKKWLAEEKK